MLLTVAHVYSMLHIVCYVFLIFSHYSLCVARVRYMLLTARYVLLMFYLLLTAGSYLYISHCPLCVSHVCIRMWFFLIMYCSGFSNAYCLLCGDHICYSLLTACSCLIVWCSLVVIYCSLCGLQLNTCCSYSVYQSRTQNMYWFSCYYFTKICIYKNIQIFIIFSSIFGGNWV